MSAMNHTGVRKCPGHKPVPLYDYPVAGADKLTYALHDYARFLLCQVCNRIGRTIYSRAGGIRWFPHDGLLVADRRQNAEWWNTMVRGSLRSKDQESE